MYATCLVFFSDEGRRRLRGSIKIPGRDRGTPPVEFVVLVPISPPPCVCQFLFSAVWNGGRRQMAGKGCREKERNQGKVCDSSADRKLQSCISSYTHPARELPFFFGVERGVRQARTHKERRGGASSQAGVPDDERVRLVRDNHHIASHRIITTLGAEIERQWWCWVSFCGCVVYLDFFIVHWNKSLPLGYFAHIQTAIDCGLSPGERLLLLFSYTTFSPFGK